MPEYKIEEYGTSNISEVSAIKSFCSESPDHPLVKAREDAGSALREFRIINGDSFFPQVDPSQNSAFTQALRGFDKAEKSLLQYLHSQGKVSTVPTQQGSSGQGSKASTNAADIDVWAQGLRKKNPFQ
jgi:hypothetical protein